MKAIIRLKADISLVFILVCVLTGSLNASHENLNYAQISNSNFPINNRYSPLNFQKTFAITPLQKHNLINFNKPLSLTFLPLDSPFKILVFTKTSGFRHDSIPAAIAAITNLGDTNNFMVDATEDAGAFNDSNLSQYKAVVFLLTTQDVLDDNQQAAFTRYIRAGNGYVGIHSASDTEYDWAWYGGLVGAYFISHPPGTQTAVVRIENRNHLSTASLPDNWQRVDEWYNFQTNPRENVNVLANLDESTYPGGTMGDHPIIWYHEYDGGRAWYTALGHTTESYSEPLFLNHILGGIRYAAGSAIEPSTPIPFGRTVALKAAVNNKFVTAENAGNNPLIANREAAQLWEQFEVVNAGNNLVALKAKGNNKYVAAENFGNNSLIANRDAIGLWEMFEWIDYGNGVFALRAVVNNKFVTAESGGNDSLIANRDEAYSWEQFSWTEQ